MRLNIEDLEPEIAELVEAALRGERVVICDHDKPVAEFVPLKPVVTPP